MNIHSNKYVCQCLYLWFSALLLQNTNVLWQYAFEYAFIAMHYHTSWWDNVFKKVIDNTLSLRESSLNFFEGKINGRNHSFSLFYLFHEGILGLYYLWLLVSPLLRTWNWCSLLPDDNEDAHYNLPTYWECCRYCVCFRAPIVCLKEAVSCNRCFGHYWVVISSTDLFPLSSLCGLDWQAL